MNAVLESTSQADESFADGTCERDKAIIASQCFSCSQADQASRLAQSVMASSSLIERQYAERLTIQHYLSPTSLAGELLQTENNGRITNSVMM